MQRISCRSVFKFFLLAIFALGFTSLPKMSTDQLASIRISAGSIYWSVSQKLSSNGSMARGGKIIDAGTAQTPRQSINKQEKAIVTENAMPADWLPANGRKNGIDARWKHGKSYFGYKLSASPDNRYKLIRRIKISTASEHDILHFEAVIDPCNTTRDIYADNCANGVWRTLMLNLRFNKPEIVANGQFQIQFVDFLMPTKPASALFFLDSSVNSTGNL